MFVCPKCGFIDDPNWKSCKWLRYSVYSNISEMEVFYPALLKKLQESENNWVFEKPYWYKLTRSGKIVYRMTEMGKSEFQTHGFTEKPKDPFQQKLIEMRDEQP